MLFIEFYADWILECQFVNLCVDIFQAKEIWNQYSNTYTTDSLKFLSVNVDRNQEIANKYRINTTGFSKQLPTVLILEDGEQVCRFPPVDTKGK